MGPATTALRPQLASGALKVRLAGVLRKSQIVRTPQLEDSISDFSSRGTHGPTVKPDVAAPGESITSVAYDLVAPPSTCTRSRPARWTSSP